MTKVFVTVGTTRFPSLVRFFDRPTRSCEIVIQHADPGYVTEHALGFAFAASVAEWYAWADVVVTHAGAGSVYELLERGQRLVVVPNLDRADTHQLDLAGHVEKRRYGLVVRRIADFGSVDELLREAMRYQPAPYVKEAFFKAEFLLSLLRE
jgi:beta-1,4-N-acetylglucosaminyltransferase